MILPHDKVKEQGQVFQRLRSFRFRMTLYFATMVVAVVLLFGGSVLGFFTYLQIQKTDTSLEDSSSRLALNLATQGSFFLSSREYLLLRATWRLLHLDFQVFDEGLNAYINNDPAQTPAFALSPRLVAKLLRKGQSLQTVDLVDQEILPMGTWLVPWHSLPDHSLLRVGWKQIRLPTRSYYVVVGIPLDDFLAARFQIFQMMMLSGLGVLVIALFIGYQAASRAMLPIRKMNEAVSQVSIDNLSVRIPYSQAGREIAELGNRINLMLGDLERSVLQLKQFTSDVSHELRTPIAVIKGKIEVTLLRERDPEYHKKSLEDISRQIQNMQSMVEGLLELARLDALTGLEEVDRSDLFLVTEDVVDHLEDLISRRQQHLFQDLDFTPVRGRPPLLNRLISNLVDNASKYTPQGGKLGIRTWVNRNRGKSCLEVWDTGPGMGPEEVRRCMDRFWRADTARTTPGYGLGLALVHRIAELHTAELEIESSPGQGSTFRICFPLDESALADYESEKDSPETDTV